MFVYHSCFPPHPFPLSTWPKAHRAVSSHCGTSQRPPCTSLTLIIKSNGPSCQDMDKGQDGPSCRQMCQHDGLLGYVKVGSRCAIHVPSCGRQTCLLLLVTLLLPRAWPLLIKVYRAIRYGMRYASALASLTFLFPTGTLWALGDFMGGPSCGLRMLFYWICPLVTPTPCRHWGIFWEGHHAASGCCSIGYAL